MKKIKSLLLISIIVLTNAACSFSPSSIEGASQIPLELNKDAIQNDILFKASFMALLPKNEQGYLDRSIRNTLKENARYNDLANARGQNGLLVGALGGNPLGGGMGGAASLALDVLSKVSNATSGADETYGMFLSKSWLGSDTNDLDEIKRITQVKVVQALTKSAKEANYTIECKFYCGQSMPTYELTRSVKNTDANLFFPEKLLVVIRFSEVIEVPDDSLVALINGDEFKYYAFAGVDIKSPYYVDDDGNIEYSVATTNFEDQKEMFYNIGAENILSTPLGRKMYRSLSKELPNWHYGGEFYFKDYGVYQGNVYFLNGLSKYDELSGTLVLN